MRAWVDAAGELYIADAKRDPADVEAPARPSAEHEWVGGAWVMPADAQDRRAQARANAMDRALFELLYLAESDKREMRRTINLLAPGSYTAQSSAEITRLQYRNAVVNLFKSLL